MLSYGATDFDDILREIAKEVDRIDDELDIYSLGLYDNAKTYKQLVTVLLTLKKIK